MSQTSTDRQCLEARALAKMSGSLFFPQVRDYFEWARKPENRDYWHHPLEHGTWKLEVKMPHPNEISACSYYKGTFAQAIAYACNNYAATVDRLRVFPLQIKEGIVETGLERELSEYFVHNPDLLPSTE